MFLQAVLDAVPEAIVVCNTEGFVLEANASAEPRLGHTEAELLGQRFSELRVPEDRRGFLERLEDDGLVGQTLLLRGQTASALAVPFEAAFNRLEVRGQQHLVASLRDVSERG